MMNGAMMKPEVAHGTGARSTAIPEVVARLVRALVLRVQDDELARVDDLGVGLVLLLLDYDAEGYTHRLEREHGQARVGSPLRGDE